MLKCKQHSRLSRDT